MGGLSAHIKTETAINHPNMRIFIFRKSTLHMILARITKRVFTLNQRDSSLEKAHFLPLMKFNQKRNFPAGFKTV
ncbi:hypothetical protein D7X94_03680 [Acutalibacter sp. 1XD8-33]|nr:hypothetical protein D7X94_03680 [Acutalibacter sp. 1XD8-33]